MGRIKYLPVTQLHKTILDMIKKWPLLLLTILIDLAFIFVFSFVYTLYFNKIMTHVNIIMQQTPMVTNALQTQDLYAAAPIAQELSRQIFEIKKLGLLIVISSFVIWIAFQTFNWYNCYKISGRKIKYLDYLKSFSITSVIWTVIVTIIMYISIQMFFGKAMSMTVSPGDATILNIGMGIAILVVGYFALTSFSLTGKIKDVLRKTIMFSFLKSKVVVSYLIILFIATIINFIIYGLFMINIAVAIIIGAVLVMLMFVYFRVYMINVIQEIDNKKVKKKRKS